jgi:hypothetical protein
MLKSDFNKPRAFLDRLPLLCGKNGLFFFLTVDLSRKRDSSPAYLASGKTFMEIESHLFVNRGTRYTTHTLLPGPRRESEIAAPEGNSPNRWQRPAY